MARDTDGGYRLCQSLVKGLDILAALNRGSGASASIAELGRLTGLHRTTIKRLLETLRDAGYVAWDPATNLYRLTFRVHQLSYGFRDNVAITEVAWPMMRALSKAIVWPCSIVSLEGDEMIVRASTRSYSPLSFHPGMPGRRLPILTTAAGRAYLAYSPPEEQEAILDLLQGRADEHAELAVDTRFVRTLIDQTRDRGYGLNQGEWSDEPKFGGVAVPLRYQERAVSCLNVIFLSRGVKDAASLRKIVSHLFEAQKGIEERFAMHKLQSG
ncbi:helix-turn-helix domain-containing protein [Pigmentiphaga sp. NML080357]|uniref:IclR family transcriptional regulator domain-containing protein n=1 Tax=Pigmentiphaga sp. NML080357 TaxID=2008675 RepID=UPI00130399B6|nr:helix-turn-helix domain-containing protein [Pigmentiphaga sp. NML080357]